MKMPAITCMLLAACSISMLTGCGNKQTPATAQKTDTQTKTETTSAETPKADATASPNQLVGMWLGACGYDEEKVEQKLSSFQTQEEKQEFLNQLKTFDSMYIAYEFAADETMEMDLYMEPAGSEPVRSQMIGRWKVDQVKGKSMQVRIAEYKADNTWGEITTKNYTFIDGDSFAVVPSVAANLKDIDPVVIFQRAAEEETQTESTAAATQKQLQ